MATDATGTPAKWHPGGDLESNCQADFSKPVVYLMDENGWLREYDVSKYGEVKETCRWDIRAHCSENNGAGPEGRTFAPDDWLRRREFRQANGSLYASTNGMGGLNRVPGTWRVLR